MNRAVNYRNIRLLLVLIFSVLSLAFCFNSLGISPALAQNSDIPEITVQSKTVHRGQTFTIDVDISNNIGLLTLFLTLDYDHSVMTLKDAVQKDALSSLTLSTYNVDTDQGYSVDKFNMFWDGTDRDYSNGTIITFTFDSSIEAPIGEYDVTITFDRQNTNIAYQTPTDISITSGVVNMITGEYQAIYRDYNGDILFEKDYNADAVPSFPDTLPTPSRAEDAEYSYEFAGWKGVPSDDINVLIFEADYILTAKEYTVFFYVDGISDYPDGIIDEAEDYFTVVEVAFGNTITFPTAPRKPHYEFFGWYENDGFQKELTFVTMPARKVKLYGYYTFEVRERNVPKISLEAEYVDENQEDVIVTANILEGNTGFSAMVLTLQYDKEVLTFMGFQDLDLLDMTFQTTNPNDLSVENFKFSYDDAVNHYEHGSFLELYFKVKPGSPEGVYDIKFTYDFHTDVTYVDANSEVKYTKIEFYNTQVPIGEINHWNVPVGQNNSRAVDVTSHTGKPINVYLEVDLITEEVAVSSDTIETKVGQDMYVSSAYNIRLMQNRKEIQPETTLVIRIKLTEMEKRGKIQFYYLNDDGELISQDFRIEDGDLVFTIDHLSNWVIFNTFRDNVQMSKVLYLVGMPILLAIATMLYAFRLKQKSTKSKKEAQND